MRDVLIIGSGPAGITAAIYAKRANLDVLLLEKEYEGTGQIAESPCVDNYPGLPGISGYELGERFLNHAKKLEIEILEDEAKGITKTEKYFQVELKSGSCLEAKTVIYAAGASHRRLMIPGSKKLEGNGISYCVSCDGAFYQGKDAAVIGGGNTALDDALLLSEICRKVFLIHRRESFRGAYGTLKLLEKKKNVEIIRSTEVKKLEKRGREIQLFLDSGRELTVHGIFAAVGMQPRTEILKGLVNLDKNGYIQTEEEGLTSAEGFYGAGDVRAGKLRQVITAAADGAAAATAAARYILEHYQ